jgi:hypothetical protein
MNQSRTNIIQGLRGGAVALALFGAGCLLAAAPANADEAHAKDLLKAMSDYLVGQGAISFTYDANLEIVTSDLQKVGFASSGTVALSRPDKIRMTRTGGFADVELVYDGTTLAATGKNLNVFTKVEKPGTIDELIDTLRFEYGLESGGNRVGESPRQAAGARKYRTAHRVSVFLG